MDITTTWEKLAWDQGGKIVYIVIDGVGGLPHPEKAGTELQVAQTPNLDQIAENFIFLYFKGFFSSQQIYKIFNLSHPEQSDFITAIASLSDSFISSGKVVKFCKQADEIFEARMAALQSAQVSIQFETYIMTPGKRANDFAEILIKKASQGVKIKLLVDNYGAKEISSSYWKNLKSSGIEVQPFNPLSWRDPLYYLRRNHRKLLLNDLN
ncbi:MAG: phospholipase D-like domain-containing protein [Cyanobacteria bacterium J06592_8]